MPTLVDLSHPLVHGQLNFPFDPKLSIVTHNTVASIGYNITQISMSTHQGTHLDAPYHFFDDGKTVDQIPLDRFYGPAVLVDLAPRRSLEPKTPITIEMLKPHEAKFQPGAKVVYRTGWDRTFGRAEFFTDFPTLTLEAAEWIARKRIGLLGMDTGTPSQDWRGCHWILLGKGTEIVLVEGLANLDRLPERFTLIALPLNIQGRDGSPIRAAAVVEQLGGITMDLIVGAILSIAGGALEGLFSLPLTRTPKWKWENIWGMGALAALVLVPWPVALLTVPNLLQVYQEAGLKVALVAIVGGLCWGVGGIFWGKAIGAVGMAMGVSLMMGLVTIFGSPVPLALKEPAKLAEPGGRVLLAALAVMIAGVCVCAWAGKLKDRGPAAAADSGTRARVPFAMGLLFCFISGAFSAILNVGFVFAEPIAAAAERLGAAKASAPNAIWALTFTANFGVNVAYTFYLMFKNRNFGLLRAPGTTHYWLGALFIGIAWPLGIILYGIGAGKMGQYGPFVAWPMMLLSSILFGNLAGALGGEWKNTPANARRTMVAGVAILVFAFLVFGVAQKLLA